MRTRFDGETITIIHDDVLMYVLPSQVENMLIQYGGGEPIHETIESVFLNGAKRVNVDYSPKRRSRVVFEDRDDSIVEVDVDEFFETVENAFAKYEEYRFGVSSDILYDVINELEEMVESVRRSAQIAGKEPEDERTKNVLKYLAYADED